MVYTKIFRFGSKTLKIKSLEDINSELEKNIQFILDKFTSELNHNVKNSSARKFNESEINIPINLSKEYVDFLDFNLDFANNFKEFFKPFTTNLPDNIADFRELYIKDSNKSRVVKIKQFKLDTSFFRSTYIIELLKNFLKESSILNYSIVIPNVIITSGSFKWESMFIESDKFKENKFQLKNSSALLIQETLFEDLILVGRELSLLKVLETQVKNMDEGGLDEVAKKFNLDVVISKDSKVQIFHRLV